MPTTRHVPCRRFHGAATDPRRSSTLIPPVVFARRTETETGGAARGAVKRDADADLLLQTDAAAAAAAAAV